MSVPNTMDPLGFRSSEFSAGEITHPVFQAGVSAPITIWLRALAHHIFVTEKSPKVGVIGMCLTGAFVKPLVIEPCSRRRGLATRHSL
jgi:hypothetical protein